MTMWERPGPLVKRLILRLFPRCVHLVGTAPGYDEGHASAAENLPPCQSTEKLVPQPQADLAFGLRTAKWLPISASV
jgi:hypothetical protein